MAALAINITPLCYRAHFTAIDKELGNGDAQLQEEEALKAAVKSNEEDDKLLSYLMVQYLVSTGVVSYSSLDLAMVSHLLSKNQVDKALAYAKNMSPDSQYNGQSRSRAYQLIASKMQELGTYSAAVQKAFKVHYRLLDPSQSWPDDADVHDAFFTNYVMQKEDVSNLIKEELNRAFASDVDLNLASKLIRSIMPVSDAAGEEACLYVVGELLNRVLLAEAEKMIRNHLSPNHKKSTAWAKGMSQLAVKKAQSGDIQSAISLAREIKDPEYRTRAIEGVVFYAFNIDLAPEDLEGATFDPFPAILDLIEPLRYADEKQTYRCRAYSSLAVQLAWAGRFDNASDAYGWINMSTYEDKTSVEIVKAMLGNGDLDAAVAFVEQHGATTNGVCYLYVAVALKKNGKHKRKTNQYINRAVECSRMDWSEDSLPEDLKGELQSAHLMHKLHVTIAMRSKGRHAADNSSSYGINTRKFLQRYYGEAFTFGVTWLDYRYPRGPRFSLENIPGYARETEIGQLTHDTVALRRGGSIDFLAFDLLLLDTVGVRTTAIPLGLPAEKSSLSMGNSRDLAGENGVDYWLTGWESGIDGIVQSPPLLIDHLPQKEGGFDLPLYLRLYAEVDLLSSKRWLGYQSWTKIGDDVCRGGFYELGYAQKKPFDYQAPANFTLGGEFVLDDYIGLKGHRNAQRSLRLFYSNVNYSFVLTARAQDAGLQFRQISDQSIGFELSWGTDYKILSWDMFN